MCLSITNNVLQRDYISLLLLIIVKGEETKRDRYHFAKSTGAGSFVFHHAAIFFRSRNISSEGAEPLYTYSLSKIIKERVSLARGKKKVEKKHRVGVVVVAWTRMCEKTTVVHEDGSCGCLSSGKFRGSTFRWSTLYGERRRGAEVDIRRLNNQTE
eukprot:gene6025-4328_t